MTVDEPCDSAYLKYVHRHCYDALIAAGFVPFRKQGVDWPLDSEFHAWVGLNAAVKSEYVQINPFVGVHAVAIEKLTSIKSGKYPKVYDRGVATYAVHLGELAPQERVFRFTRHTDVPEEAARLARLYLSVGLPYAQSIASYERLLPLLQSRVARLGGYPEAVASCLYLMDRRDEAQAFVKRFAGEHPDYFDGFAIPFSKLLRH